MSQNNSQKTKFPGYNSNPPRGHADFGQGGYQQYAFAPALPSGNSGHDMTKPVAAAQPGMPYAAGMPTSAQHHQSSMGGPVPSPQPIMQQGQQISRAPLSFYRGNSVPRSMPNMSRNPLTAVVNQPSQQATSQFSHVQMVPSPPYHMPPMIMNNFHQMYLQRPNYPQQYSITPQQAVYVNNWNNFNTPPPECKGEIFKTFKKIF
ncbi:uncharacterized protein TNIN_313171 [Trichonephila inaurata madagascariensis]|uniref:Uncharacterized protein n=1 Tax=Trichonephila inaurata madagascariensis TaxID=2747483 RepID=A0A8X6WZ29_9ARAC|nr:uncharacterized protein TNIN_313171 [Trichonephila inaurata madagascariensis]